MMGTSKKHKHDREHKKKKKRHSKSRSRSPSRERQEKADKRPVEYDYEEENQRSSKRRRYDHRDEEDVHHRSSQVSAGRSGQGSSGRSGDVSSGRYGQGSGGHYEEGEVVEDGPAAAATSSQGEGLSLSIEQTNKLRAKLGLKPLESKSDDSKGKLGSTDTGDIHKPAVNLAELKRQKELREKLALAKEKRQLQKKLGKVKVLGQSDSDDESAAQWVTKSRKQQKEKDMADKRAKLLEEMDEEFGIGTLVDEAFGRKKEISYSSKDLKGLRVEHAMDSFKEGRTTILTLQDRAILDEGDDVLVNMNIIDDEKTAKNLENKKKKPDYQPYDDAGVNEYGMLKVKDVLEKYDEEIVGAKKDTFTLDAKGSYNAEHERRMAEFKSAIQQKAETLSLPALRPASEFYTEAEMESFKTVKKKVRKIRKKPKMVTADDLQPLEEGGGQDMGSRGSRGDVGITRSIKKEPEDDDEKRIPGLDLVVQDEHMDMELVHTQDITGADLSHVKVEVDEAGLDLELALNKARRLLRKDKPTGALEKLAEKIQVKPGDSSDEEGEASFIRKNITLNQTSEFCRSLGEIPTYGQAGNRVEDEDELLDFERELEEERRRAAAAAAAKTEDSGWQEVEVDANPVDLEGGEDQAILDDEPVASKGMAEALELAVKKGYIKEEKGKGNAPKTTSIAALNYSIEDKRYDDLDDKFRNKAQRYMVSGAVSDFAELEGYKPDIKITYTDDMGRQMNEKEAFRYLSHRFHGKGSGKSKIEKRSKKQDLDQLMKTMGSSDTPLNTASMLEGKLQREKMPYLVLSGTGKTQTLAK